MKQIIHVFVWAILAAVSLAAATEPAPKECIFGTPDYNETLCNETCTKDIHMQQAYCANFTTTTTTTTAIPTTAAAPEVPQKEEVTGLPSVPQEVMRNIDLTTPSIDLKITSGVSSQFSIFISVSCLLFSLFVNSILL